MSENLSKRSATPQLTIDPSGNELPGLLIRYTEPPQGFDFSDIAALLLGVGIAALGGFVMFGGESFNWYGTLVLLAGLLVLAGVLIHGKDLRRGLKFQYRVQVADGMATFSHNDDAITLEVAKIGRLWISRESINSVPSAAKISAYYNGNTITIFDIFSLSCRLGDQDHLLLKPIVDYLNQQATAAAPHKNRAGDTPIQSGYRPDYAAETPLAARNIQALASPQRRLCFSAGIALLMLLLYFSTDYPALAFFNRISSPLLSVLCLFFVVPFLYSLAAEQLHACSCRSANLGTPLVWTVFATLAGLALQTALNFIAVQLGLHFPDLLTVVAMLTLMTSLLYRSFAGCNCGARPKHLKVSP